MPLETLGPGLTPEEEGNRQRGLDMWSRPTPTLPRRHPHAFGLIRRPPGGSTVRLGMWGL